MFKWTCLNWLWDCWSAECFTLTYYLNDFLSLELMAPFCFEFFVISFLIYLNISFVLSCNSMPLNGCSFLYIVNTNEKKKKKKNRILKQIYFILCCLTLLTLILPPALTLMLVFCMKQNSGNIFFILNERVSFRACLY